LARGASNARIARRPRATLENLLSSLAADRTIERLYSLPENLALVRVPDAHERGGSLAPRTTGHAQ
jgi:hypothetical protein